MSLTPICDLMGTLEALRAFKMVKFITIHEMHWAQDKAWKQLLKLYLRCQSGPKPMSHYSNSSAQKYLKGGCIGPMGN